MQGTREAFAAEQKSDTSGICRNEARSDRSFEPCVVCGKVTKFLFRDPIDKREHYIEGAGQLCSSCAAKFDSASF